MKQLGLFSRNLPKGQVYPEAPGYQPTDTSYRAAKRIRKAADCLITACLEILKREELTPDEIAAKLGTIPGNIRPRCSELRRRGLVTTTGVERPSINGAPMDVLRAVEVKQK